MPLSLSSVQSKTGLLAIGTLCVMCAAMLSVASSTPSVLTPFSIPALMPTVLASITQLPHPVIAFLGALPISTVYAICMAKGSQHNLTISNSSIVLITFSALLAVIYNALYFQQGVELRGLMHTVLLSLLNIVFITSLPMTYWRYLYNKSLFSYLRFYTLFFVWLGFCAFPWYGQV